MTEKNLFQNETMRHPEQSPVMGVPETADREEIRAVLKRKGFTEKHSVLFSCEGRILDKKNPGQNSL